MTPSQPDEQADDTPRSEDPTEVQPDSEEGVDREAEETMSATDPPANY